MMRNKFNLSLIIMAFQENIISINMQFLITKSPMSFTNFNPNLTVYLNLFPSHNLKWVFKRQI